MTDNAAPQTGEQRINGSAESNPAPSKPGRKTMWILIAAGMGGLCLLSVLCVAVILLVSRNVMVERDPVGNIIESFMTKMVAKDISGAYALFSPRAKRQFPSTDLGKMLDGNNYFLFDGYQSITIQNIKITSATNSNPDVPQGTLATVDGTVSYSGGVKGKFDALLEKVNGDWMLDRININIPPEKVKP